MPTPRAYYNEFDSKAAAWLRELIREGHIAPGDVDERSIEDVSPGDLAGYTQCHFFAGIGGWSYALRLAGWPDDSPAWTGSCPCQPFSAAGKGGGFADERHLWPAWHWLIRQRRPSQVFGEQVANALQWLDLVSTDLEGESYAVGAAIIGAHSVGAPHIRQRLYWVADSDSKRQQERRELYRESRSPDSRETSSFGYDASGSDSTNIVALSEGQQPYGSRDEGRGRGEPTDNGRLGDAPGVGRQQRRPESNGWRVIGPWDNAAWIDCRDGKVRPVEPGTFPLAHGVSGRVGLLRGYGNAIVPQDAAEFIKAYLSR